MSAKLCVNIDHVATLRQVRLEPVPDPVEAAIMAEDAGAIGITAHLREDRRHVQDHDMARLRKVVRGKFNMEMAATPEMVRIACRLKPDEATLVPEKRAELTTEGGLEVAGQLRKITEAVRTLRQAGIQVSLFITPDAAQIKASALAGAHTVELHTGAYAHAFLKGGASAAKPALERLKKGALLAQKLGLVVNAGHGLTYDNVRPVAKIPGMQDLNIGHNLIACAVLYGMSKAVKEMISAMGDR